MNQHTRKQMKSIEKLRLPELQARFAEIVGEPTRSPNKKYLLRRIIEALEAQAQEAAAGELAQPTEPEPTPVGDETTSTDGNEKKLSKLSVEELQALYTEVVGRSSGSSDRRYVELTDMGSCKVAAACSPWESAQFAPHIQELADGRMTLRFPRADACMPTSTGSGRSEGERA